MLVLCEILNSCHLSTFIAAIPWWNSRGSFRVRKSKRGNELKLVTASLLGNKYLNNPSTWCQADTSTWKTKCSSVCVCRWVCSLAGSRADGLSGALRCWDAGSDIYWPCSGALMLPVHRYWIGRVSQNLQEWHRSTRAHGCISCIPPLLGRFCLN